MDNDKCIKDKIDGVDYLYEYDLLKDFLQDEYREDDFLYNFYSSDVEGIECTNLPNCIYELLWAWSEKESKRYRDVMNSFNTYMNKMIFLMSNENKSLKGVKETFEKITGATRLNPSKKFVFYVICDKNRKEKMKNELKKMNELAKWTNTIGNFILLPNTSEEKRGENVFKNNNGNDRMDKYLVYLKKKRKEEEEDKDKDKVFKEYINENYLWDYVDKEYNIIPLFEDKNNQDVKNLPEEPKKYNEFSEKVINNIKRRGMFIEIMIRLNMEAPDIFKDVKDTKGIDSYAKAIERIKKYKEHKSEKLKFLIENIKN